jgi:tetratricopeptide (TPR) repeat protein
MSGAAPADHDRRAAEYEALAVADPADAARRFAPLRSDLESAGDFATAARVARSAINVFAHLGETGEALRIAAHARRSARGDRASRPAQIEAARVLVAAMHPRAKRGNMSGALRAGTRAVRELEALGEHALVARAELNLANVAKALGRPADAAALLERVLAHGAVIDPIRGAALNALGESCVQLAEFSRAIGAFEEAARFYEAQDGHLHAALARGNLAHTLAKSGDIEAALRAFRVARERFGALGAHAEACRLALEEAELLEDAGLVQDAADLADDAGALALHHGLRAEEARAALLRGRLEANRGYAHEALPHLDRARSITTALGDRIGMSQSEVARAACLARCGRHADAVVAAEAALAIAETPIERVFALLASSVASANAGSALLAAREARTLADTLGLPALSAEASLAEARAGRRAIASAVRGERGDAQRDPVHGASLTNSITTSLAAARAAVDGVERVQDRLAVATLRRSFLSHRLEAYHELASLLLARADAASVGEALETLERARDRTILEALARSATRREPAGSHALDPRERRADVIASMSRAARADARAELDRAVDRSHDVHLATNADPVHRAHLDAHAVVFLEDGPVLGAFLVPRSTPGDHAPRFMRITDDLSALLDCIARFRFQVARHLSGATATSARAHAAGRTAFDALRTAIFGPIAHELRAWGGDPIVVVPSRSLAGLPLGLLAPDETLLSIAPSLGIAARLDANASLHRTKGSTQSLVVSVADEHTAGFAREGHRVAGRLRASNAVARANVVHLDGADATRAAFIEALGTSDSAHIACHGLFPPDAPNLAGLLLADGWFGARDAHDLPRAPAEIVLSGCSTGLASDAAGEQWFGLLRGFAAAGASRMIASLWPVRDEEGERMMEAVYGAEAAGVAPTEPRTRRLVSAARSMLASGAHPAAAAAFAVIGGATAFRPSLPG